MRFVIRHEIRGRIRLHVLQQRMTCEEADILHYFLSTQEQVTAVKVYHQTQDAVICYIGSRQQLLSLLQGFRYEDVRTPKEFLQSSGRELNESYREKMILKLSWRMLRKLLVPYPLRAAATMVRSVGYLKKGAYALAGGRIEVAVLDAVSIGVSLARNDLKTASSIMFLLSVGELLEEWTHKKSVGDLARSMSLDIQKVWLLVDEKEVLVSTDQVSTGDSVVVHMGNVIPFDGIVTAGEGMVNQSSMTGESLPVRKVTSNYVYAGTVLEEGELTVRVNELGGSSRYEKITAMIEESEKLKSAVEGNAAHLADRVVPYTLAGAALTGLLTGNPTKAIAVLMVDFSCALKLAMPIAVLSAIREARQHQITVKGGRFLEAVAEADTIVFDKTGTLTKAQPTVAMVVPFCGETEDQLLKLAACLEEHFPHSMAKAVVDAAKEKGLEHEELHSEVNYIVAHGIASIIDAGLDGNKRSDGSADGSDGTGGKKAVIGSAHFVFEDEGCVIPEGMQERFDALPAQYSHLYLAIEHQLAAVICIEDPLRREAAEVARAFKAAGVKKVVMMTGDSERTACAIAESVGVDEYYAEVLPEDKAGFIEREKAQGHKVIMIGDGINDSPALSAADAGIAISDGAEIAREIADIMIAADDLSELLTLKQISDGLMKRIQHNYRTIVGFNTGLILLGIGGILQPAASALLHNTSTLAISLSNMRNLLE